ncbi:MAG: efflux RND transporter periplasmic adaptor subunit [Acidobacteriia bacterium]|nr:efflux RND transporter periplasmic adaptor subunit [Terriglobia bacterium]
MARIASLVAAVPFILTAASCGQGRDPSLIVASGHVEATDVRISTKIGGRLQSFPIQEGDRVARGQELARIDTTDLDLLLEQARAERAQADADLRLRVAGSRKEDVAVAAAQVAQAEADLAGAQKDLDRLQGLLDAGSGTSKGRDDALTRRDVASARRDVARETLERLRAGSRSEEIDAARAHLATTDARIAQLGQQMKDAVTTSPLAAVVTEKIAEQGELLPPGAPLCIVTDLGDAWLTVYVAEPDLARIRIGQEADVVTDGGQSRKGKVTFVASEAEFTPKNVQTRDERVKLVYRVKVGLENGDGLFKPGMPAEARLRSAGDGR